MVKADIRIRFHSYPIRIHVLGRIIQCRRRLADDAAGGDTECTHGSLIRQGQHVVHRVTCKDGFGSDTDEIGSGCHLLPHFNPDTNTNADIIGYEYKTNSSNPDTNPDTFSI